METAKYITQLHTCENCFLDIEKQIKANNRFKLRGLKEIESYQQYSCDCECYCFDDCECSECDCEGVCDCGRCDCECKCKEICKCVFGKHLTCACLHSDAILIKCMSLKARVLSDKKTHLLTNNARRRILELASLLQKKKKEQGDQRFIYHYLE